MHTEHNESKLENTNRKNLRRPEHELEFEEKISLLLLLLFFIEMLTSNWTQNENVEKIQGELKASGPFSIWGIHIHKRGILFASIFFFWLYEFLCVLNCV